MKHGRGSDIFANGDTYTGQYYKGKPDGQGEYKWKNGSLYSGQFKNGLKHGKGKWRKGGNSPATNNYEGDYFMDKKHGYGVFKWASGNVYKGNYKEDERHGYGEMYWTDGSIYKGEWTKGIQHGFGEMIFPDGTKKVGMFDHNTFVSPVNDNSQTNTYDLLKKGPSSLTRKLEPLNESAEFDYKGGHDRNNSMATSFSKTKLRPIQTPINNKFSLKKLSTPSDFSFDKKLEASKNKKNLPPLGSRITTTQVGNRKNRKLNDAKSNESFELGLLGYKNMNLIDRSKNLILSFEYIH